MHQMFHHLHHNAGKTYRSLVLGVILGSLLVYRSDIGTGQVKWHGTAPTGVTG